MKFLLTVLFLILLILFSGIGWIIGTESGLRFLVAQAQQFAPGELKIEHFEGRLIDKIHFTGLSYQQDETIAQVNSFLFDWDANALLSGKVHLEQLHVDNVNVHLPETQELEKPEEKSGPFKLPDIKLPIQIAIDDVQINHVSFQTGHADPFIIDNIALRSTTTDVLSLQHFQIDSPQFNAKLAGDVGLIAPHTVQLDLNWSAKLPEFTVVGEGQLSGDIQQMTLTHTVSEPLEVDLKGTVTDVLGALNMNVELTWQEIYWPFNPKIPKDYMVHSQKGLVTLIGSLENYQLHLIANVAGQQIPAGYWSIAAQGNQQAITLEKLHSKILTGVIDATGHFSWQPRLAGQLNLNVDDITIKYFWKEWPNELRIDSRVVAELDGDNFKVDQLDITIPQTGAKVSLIAEGVHAGDNSRFKTAKLTWKNAQWPLMGFDDAIVVSKQGQVDLSGPLQDYQLKLNTHITGAQIPPGKLALTGGGSLQDFTIESLNTDILKGIVKATGKVSWQPKLMAQLNLNTNNITIKHFWKDWPRNLTINSQIQALLDDKNFKISKLDLKLPQTAAHISLVGEGTFTKEGPVFKEVNLDWQKLQWPLVGKKTLVNSQVGTVNLSGSMQGYQVEGNTQIVGEQIPPGNITVSGYGDLEEFTLQSLHAELLKGAVTADGLVRWKPTLAAQVNLEVNSITVKPFWKDWPEQLRINSNLVANLDDKYFFEVQQLYLELPQTATQLALQAEGSLLDGPRFENATLAWQGAQWPLMGKKFIAKSQEGTVNLIGTLQDYQVDLATQFTMAQIPTGYLTLVGKGSLEQFTIDEFNSDILQGTVNATGQVAWQPTLKGQINLDVNEITIKDLWKDWPEQLNINTHLVADIDDQDFQINTLNVNIPQTDMQLSLQGDGILNGEQTRFNTNLIWANLQWPLVGKDILVNTPNGQLSAKGSAQAYQLILDTEINGKDIPAGRWQATGSGNTESLQLQSLQANILQGALDLSGNVRWQPNVSWQIDLAGDNINPGTQWNEWPGKIALNLSSKGKLLKNGTLETQVDIRNITGNLRNYPLQLQTGVAVKMPPTPIAKKGKKSPKSGFGTISINHLEFKSGNNSVTANGQLGDKSKLDWTINAADLAAVLPEAQGRLTGKGRISGPLNLPHVTANLKGNGLAFQENSLQMLRADVDINLLTQKNLHLDIMAKDFKQGDTTQVKRATIAGKGSMKNHSLVAKVNLPQDRISLELQGNFKLKQSQWLGKLQDIEASTEKFGYWQLQKPVALTLSATEAQLARACLNESKSGTVCTKLNWQKIADTKVQLTLDELPLNIAPTLFPKNMDITGTLNGELATTLRSDGKINSNVAFNLSPGMVKMIVADENQELKFQGGGLKLKIAQNGLMANLQLGLLDESGLQSTFTMPRLTHIPLASEQPIQGNLQAKFADFGILPLFAPQLENTKGMVNVDLGVGGTLTQPLLQGQIRVENVEVDLPDFGLELKKFNVTVLAKEQDIQMQGSINSGEGQLNLKGQGQLMSLADWKADLKLTGKDFQVIDISEAWVLATPNIDIKVVPGKLDVIGEVTIPEAAFTPPHAASGAVTVSKDVVIVNPVDPKPEEEKPVSSPMAISSKVKVILGDNVTFEGAGFKSRFGGEVTATTTIQPGQEMVNIGNGELYVFDGSYKAYGQNLTIDKGKVFFSGGPIDNPGLDIPAYRLIKRSGDEDVTAGVYIQGTAQAPRMELFSNPSFDQSNTLSYIILGKPAAEAAGSEGDILLSAAMSLPLGKANTIASKLGKDLGLDEAGVTTDEELGGAALMVGKYLTPGLYISYGVGLFDGSNLLRMRYDLTKNVTLETETGTQSGVDLRYTIDW